MTIMINKIVIRTALLAIYFALFAINLAAQQQLYDIIK
jgi:hypothetical protein